MTIYTNVALLAVVDIPGNSQTRASFLNTTVSMDDAELETNKAKQASAEGVLHWGSTVPSVRSRSLFTGMIQNDIIAFCAQNNATTA